MSQTSSEWPRIGVVTEAMAELTRLASHLAARRHLAFYGTGFVPPDLVRAPSRVRAVLGRRSLPPGVEPHVARSFAPVQEVLGTIAPGRLGRARQWFMDRRSGELGRRAGRELERAPTDALVISHGAALEAFRHDCPALRVLNMPSVHPRFRTATIEAEIERCPDLAPSMTADLPPHGRLARFDEEFELADLVLVPSRFAAHTLEEYGVPSGKIVVVPYGAHLAECANDPKEVSERLEILYVGRITQSKGLSYLLDAHARLRTGSAGLSVVGGTAAQARLFSRYGRGWVHRAAVPRSQVSGYFRSADVFVLPSLFEGMSLSVLEAMGHGLPVIVTPASGAADLVTDGVEGFVVPERRPDVLADRLRQLADDPVRRSGMGRAARRRAEAFTWQTYAETTFAAVVKVLASHA
ncbi:hypothetical protein GCM10009872_55120 [Actinopolymorpha rutila]